MSMYKEGDKVLVDSVDGSTGFVEVEITAVEYNYFNDLRYRAGKRIIHPEEIRGQATGHTAEIVAALNSRHNRDREQTSVSSTGGAKNVKPEKFSLIPTQALAKVAEHYGVGAEKYAAHQWRQGYEWSKSYDALQRHANAFWAGEDNDPETRTPHMAAVAFHAMTLLTFMDEHPNHDDRYKEQI